MLVSFFTRRARDKYDLITRQPIVHIAAFRFCNPQQPPPPRSELINTKLWFAFYIFNSVSPTFCVSTAPTRCRDSSLRVRLPHTAAHTAATKSPPRAFARITMELMRCRNTLRSPTHPRPSPHTPCHMSQQPRALSLIVPPPPPLRPPPYRIPHSPPKEAQASMVVISSISTCGSFSPTKCPIPPPLPPSHTLSSANPNVREGGGGGGAALVLL